jgi:transposase InsO family protein
VKKAGIRASRKKVRQSMEKYNLAAKAAKKIVVTTNSKHHLPVSPNLLMRNFKAAKPNTVWAADFTYAAAEFGWR